MQKFYIQSLIHMLILERPYVLTSVDTLAWFTRLIICLSDKISYSGTIFSSESHELVNYYVALSNSGTRISICACPLLLFRELRYWARPNKQHPIPEVMAAPTKIS